MRFSLVVSALLGISTLQDSYSPKQLEGYTLERKGDPRVGTVYWLQQRHAQPFDNLDVRVSNTSEVNKIATHQYAILSELFRLNTRYVTPENITATEISDLAQNGYLSGIRDVFPNGFPQRLNDKQRLYISEIGAAEVYGAIGNNVAFYPSATERMRVKVQAFQEKLLTMTPTEFRSCSTYQLMVVDRENELVDSLCGFFKEHPGESITVVYGALHTALPQRFDGRCNPRVYSRFLVTDGLERELKIVTKKENDPWKHCYSK